MSLSPQEVVRHLRSRKAPGLDGIANEALRFCSGEITGHLADIAGYHPKSFHRTVTIMLRNEEKPGYFVPRSYRPIALENTLGKVVEKLTADRLSVAMEDPHAGPRYADGCAEK
jgi:hypothetical protein